MILHYLKVAVRNLLKYRTQSVISIMGLAVGFACFALAAIWIKYEFTYDSFHEDAGQICVVRIEDKNEANGLRKVNPYVLAGYLKENFPEVKGACSMQKAFSDIKSDYFLEGKKVSLYTCNIDSAAFSVFDIEIIEGSHEFLLPYKWGQPHKIAITRRGAQELFGDENPIGKELYSIYQKDVPLTICAVVSEWPYHTNMKYDILDYCFSNDNWMSGGWQTFIRLHKNVRVRDFAEKIYNHQIDTDGGRSEPLSKFVLTPLTSLRYDRPDIEGNVKFKHVLMFSLAGALVILCCLLNYISLFINRIRTRSKEFALRIVNGSSSYGLFKLLMCEFILLLLSAWLVGMMFIEISIRPFKALSEVTLGQFDIYGESAVCCLFMIIISTLFAAFPILYYRRKSVQSVLSAQTNGRNKDLFRKGSILFQLIVGIGFIFCASVIMKQLHFLKYTDAGMKRNNIAVFRTEHMQELGESIKQFPEVDEVLIDHYALIPYSGGLSLYFRDWKDKTEDLEPFSMKMISEDTAYARFYGLQILEGNMITSSSLKNEIVINESAVKAFGWHPKEAVGKYIVTGGRDTTHVRVIGVMKDFYNESPTLPVKPIGFGNPIFVDYQISGINSVLIKYKEESWDKLRIKIDSLVQQNYPFEFSQLTDTEEEYDKFLTSEQALLKMLTALSIVCIIISVFGIYSQVVLTCEQRRKEIAIRKVNGAKLGDILSIFAKEYMMLLIMASVIAFAVGYTIMKHWLENYTRQTDMSFWVFASIFTGVALIVAFSIGYRVWKAANENPADVVKSE